MRIRPRSKQRDAQIAGANEIAEAREERAIRAITRGSLQMVASMLLGQIPQKSAGEDEMRDGIKLLKTAQDALRHASKIAPPPLKRQKPSPKKSG
jgi:hypothetical protein